MEKLVRDLMPEICENTPGYTPMKFRYAADKAELAEFFLDKLVEEAKEVRRAKNREEILSELADIQEIIKGICENFDIHESEVAYARDLKFAKRGGFYKGIIWDGKK